MPYFKELINVIEKYNDTVKRYSNGEEITKEEEIFMCGISFEIAKALAINNTETAVKVAKMILAYKETNEK